MCGFAAIFEHGRNLAPPLLDAMERDLFHRGPDSGGRYAAPGAALVFRRLAILDPTPRADQPIRDASGRYVMVFNGEIYNFRALAERLQTEGARLRTRGDAEIIIEGFARWGEAIFGRLEGMFAVVILDTREGRLTAARDPFGIKPLYFARRGRFLGLASEMRPLRRALGDLFGRQIGRSEADEEALAELLMFRYAAAPLSNIKDIALLPGGTLLRFSLNDGACCEARFCDPLETIAPAPVAEPDHLREEIEDALAESVRAHLQSDVGYAVQLSGGVDSSLVLAMASAQTGREIETYGVHLIDGANDEAPYRRAVVDRYHPRHHEITLGAHDFAEALPKAVQYMEGPTPHFGCVMLMLLCERIAERHKVVLTGEGADEFFGGYDRYARWRELARLGAIGRLAPAWAWELPWLRRYRYLQRFTHYDAAVVSSIYFDFPRLHAAFPDLVPDPGKGARAAAARRFSDFRDRLLAVDQSSYLSSLLMRQDKMAMAAGVEARVPFTHLPLARLLNRLPRDLRIPGGETKPLLKAIARRHLPREVVDRRKVGLTLPLEAWLRDTGGLGRYLELLTEPSSRLATYARHGALVELVDEFRKGRRGSSGDNPPLAHLVNLELWLRSLDRLEAPTSARAVRILGAMDAARPGPALSPLAAR